MASYPSFDPNQLATFDGTQLNKVDKQLLADPSQPLLNRAINATFPPGSTFKIVTSSTAFSTGRYNPDTRVYAPTNLKLPQHHQPADQLRQRGVQRRQQPDRHRQGAAHLRVHRVLQHRVRQPGRCTSAGPRCGAQAEQVRHEQPEPDASRCRSRRATTRRCPAPRYTAYSAIGQYSDTVTPLQEAMFSAAIANNGTLMTPYMVQKVTAPDLTTLETAQPDRAEPTGDPGRGRADVKQHDDQRGASRRTAPPTPAALHPGTSDRRRRPERRRTASTTSGLDDAVFTCFAPASQPADSGRRHRKGRRPRRRRLRPDRGEDHQAYLASLGKQ